jgi:hypothetical protein
MVWIFSCGIMPLQFSNVDRVNDLGWIVLLLLIFIKICEVNILKIKIFYF